MEMLADVLVVCVALIHLFLMVLEMVLWEKSFTLELFGMDSDFASATRELAANQGLYNGFLAAGLLWSLSTGDMAVQQFFLGCVLVAGVYAALTVHARAIMVQSLPAVVALALTWWAGSGGA